MTANDSRLRFVIAAVVCLLASVLEGLCQLDLSDPILQYDIGKSLFDEASPEGNYEQSETWFMKSAEQGYTPAKFMLGVIYQEGNDSLRNLDKSYFWFKSAADDILNKTSDHEIESEQEASGTTFTAADGKGALDEIPYAISQITPKIPTWLQGEKGSTVLTFIIDEHGDILDLKTLETTHQEYSKASVDAIEKWEFLPAKRDGVAVPARVLQRFNFYHRKPRSAKRPTSDNQSNN